MTDPMPHILSLLAGVNEIRKAELTPTTTRDDLIKLLERHADVYDDGTLISVEQAADVIVDAGWHL